MERSISTHGIVIRRERSAEFHKSLTMLTTDLGLITATAYGAFKMNSRLRLGSEPFTWSRVLLYHNPVRRSYKVTEMEILASFEGLQRDLSRLAAASLWAEVVQKSYGAGELSGGLFRLFLESLQLLDAAESPRESYVTLQFLWRFLALAGYQPDTRQCDGCGREFAESETAFYAARSHALLCAACASGTGQPLPAGALRFLDATSTLPIDKAVEVSLGERSLHALCDSLPRMLQAVLEGQFSSLPWVEAGR